MYDPLISIIIPVYNVEKYLERCIESVIAQTYSNIEILLINDGSLDNSLEICHRFEKKDHRIVCFDKKNGGLGDARNYGVTRARSEWIIFVDSDDYVSKHYVMNLWNLKKRYDADFVSCRPHYVDDLGNTVKTMKPFKPFTVLGSEESIFEMYFGKNGFISAWAKLIPKQLLLEFPFPDGYYEDFACLYKILSRCNKVVFADNGEDYFYVQREGSILNSTINEKHLAGFLICDDIADFFSCNYPKLFKYSVLLYQRQVIQVLNKQHLSNEEFNMVYYKYRNLFKREILRVAFLRRIGIKQKIYTFLLCSNPSVYRIVAGR